MRYVVAVIGAALLFVVCAVLGLILTAFPALQGTLRMPLGWVDISLRNPVWLVGPALGILAAVHSYRSTIKRYAAKVESTSRE